MAPPSTLTTPRQSPLGRASLGRTALSRGAGLGRSPSQLARLRLSDSYRPTLYPGVERALARIAARGLRIGVATNNSRERCLAHNQRLGLTRFFRQVLGARGLDGRVVAEKKPAPDMLLRLARDLGVAPSEMIFVGDAPSDVEAGHNAGMTTVALENGSATRAELEAVRPTYILRGFAELPALLERIARQGQTVRAVGIDMDGTYIDSWTEYREAVRAAARDVGVEVSRRDLDQALSRRAFGGRHDDAGGLIPRDKLAAFQDAFNRRYVETFRGESPEPPRSR